MKSNTIKNTLKGIGFGLFMAIGLVAFSSTEANAQYRNDDNRQERREDRQDRRNGSQLYSVARENGYRDGQAAGRDDRRDRDRDNARKSPEYKKATNGYYARLGDKNAYKDAYRESFLQGYNSTYNRNGRGNNNRRGN